MRVGRKRFLALAAGAATATALGWREWLSRRKRGRQAIDADSRSLLQKAEALLNGEKVPGTRLWAEPSRVAPAH